MLLTNSLIYMKNKSILVIVAIIIIAVIAVIFEGGKKSSDRVVKVGYLSILTGAPHFIALDQKLYENAGIKIEATQFQSSNQLYDAIANGDIDITPELSALPVLINHIKDTGRVEVFTTTKFTTEYPFDQLVVKNESKIIELTDLAGKKIGVFPGSTATAFLKDYLSKNNVDTSKIEYVQIPPQNQLQAFEANSIDALYAYEPNLAMAQVKHARVLGTPIFSSYLENNPLGVGIVSKKFKTEYPSLTKKIIGVYDQSFDYLVAKDQESRAILVREMKIDPEVAEKMNLVYHVKSTEINEEYLQKLIDILISFKELPSQPDLSTLFYK